MRLIEVGAPNVAIARELGISRGVVRNHIKEIYRHHGVHTRAALAAKLGCLSVQPVPALSVSRGPARASAAPKSSPTSWPASR